MNKQGGKIWVITKFVVDGGALELVDASNDKETREEGGRKPRTSQKRTCEYAGSLIRNVQHIYTRRYPLRRGLSTTRREDKEEVDSLRRGSPELTSSQQRNERLQRG